MQYAAREFASKVCRLATFLLLLAVQTSTMTMAGESAPVVDVGFLASRPLIDGELDPVCQDLPQQSLDVVQKSNISNPAGEVRYRLGYGTNFFYLYLEADAEKLHFRDRAYQNGDGLNLQLALPKNELAPTDEFYVLAASAVDRPELEWSRRIFWYYNVDHVFKRTSPDTLVEFHEGGGKISFEVLLPWKDVYPYHPWLSKALGINLAFVQAVEPRERNRFMLLEDEIGAENSLRKYVMLRFTPPGSGETDEAYALLARNHIEEGEPLTIQAATLSAAGGNQKLRARVLTGEGERVMSTSLRYEVPVGLGQQHLSLPDVRNLPAGAYLFNWSLGDGQSKGETPFSVTRPFDTSEFGVALSKVGSPVDKSTLDTLQFMAQELEDQLNALKPYETAGLQRLAVEQLFGQVRQLQHGSDPYQHRTGFMRKAYRSKLDNSLQPYTVMVPEDYDPAREYPLIVFLHGSAVTEMGLQGWSELVPECCIALGPFGRGHSNHYVRDHAQEDIDEAIEAVMGSYSIDDDKIILAGFSMGGYGVWPTYVRDPDKYAGVVSLSGTPYTGYGDGTQDPDFRQQANLKPFLNTPVFVAHGAQDNVCLVEDTRQMVHGLREAGAAVEFHIEENGGHAPPGPEVMQEYYRWLDRVLREGQE